MREPTHPHLSGWCSGQAGCDSGRAHDICQGRLDAELLARCECDRHETPVVERDKGSEQVALGGAAWDNGDAKSDPALRQQPGSRPNSVRSPM